MPDECVIERSPTTIFGLHNFPSNISSSGYAVASSSDFLLIISKVVIDHAAALYRLTRLKDISFCGCIKESTSVKEHSSG